MSNVIHLLETYGYWAIFLSVLLDFLGAPITTIPLLVLAGAAAGEGRMSLGAIALLATLAAFAADSLWYGLGRLRGKHILGMFCGLTRDREQCVNRSTEFATRYTVASLLFSKFLPGLATIAPPAAGATGTSVAQFLVLDALGSFLWAGVFAGSGFVLSRKLDTLFSLTGRTAEIGIAAILLYAAVITGVLLRKKYFIWKARVPAQEWGNQ